VEYFVDVSIFYNFFSNEFILFVKFVYLFETGCECFLIDRFVAALRLVVSLEALFYLFGPNFDFTLHALADGVAQASQLHVYLDFLLLRQALNFASDKFLG
jgi:hypothetical protein